LVNSGGGVKMKVFILFVLTIVFLSPANAADKNDAPNLYLYSAKDKFGNLIKLGHFIAQPDMKRAIGKAFAKRSVGRRDIKIGGFSKIKPRGCYVVYRKKAKARTDAIKYKIYRDNKMAKV
jgi:hypothetical protein